MSKVRYTPDQQKVINVRNRNVLVSAAAGSGKTAVLVERIITMITKDQPPMDVDELLVVTFTNAAAAEMKERIAEALYEKIEENPTDHRLTEQLTKLPGAHIMTLHAFCLRVIKEHFFEIDLDPSFNIGDEVTLNLMRSEVMEEVIESFYKKEDSDFIDFVEAYAPGKKDDQIEGMVMDLFRMSMAQADPTKWLQGLIQQMTFENLEAFYNSDYVAIGVENIKAQLTNVKHMCTRSYELISMDPLIAPVGETIAYYYDQVEQLMDIVQQPKQLIEGVGSIDFIRAKSPKKGADPDLATQVKNLRDAIKKSLQDLATTYANPYDETFLGQMAISRNHMASLVELVLAFYEAYQKAKADELLIDFNDIEHFALNILSMDEGRIGDTYKKKFREILVDEYQDSNMVQETLINLVSRVKHNEPNIFMVGDVKQSIYKFRMAKPELFIQKYDDYTLEESPYQKIELHKNFRSRRQILDTTNFLFQQIMTREMGDVVYDDHASLHLGASYDEGDHYGTEVILCDRSESGQMDATTFEAHHVARHILSMLKGDQCPMIYDKSLGTKRKADYQDIVILMRSMASTAPAFLQIFGDYGIPVKSNTTTGYFETMEVKTLMNLLAIVDNPKQDIALISILHSPIFEFTPDELAKVRNANDKVDLHTALVLFEAGGLTNEGLEAKVSNFLETIRKYREIRHDMSLVEFVDFLLQDTNFKDMVGLMPGGPQRVSNLEMFMSLVVTYEGHKYRSLTQFLLYMGTLKQRSVDYGEAPMNDGGKSQVTIMSIHGSKGLEFPIVYVAGMGKAFNTMDLKQKIMVHQQYGIGTDCILTKERLQINMPTKLMIRQVLEREMKAEEMRILYVALTRAREKLILVGSVRSLEKSMENWNMHAYEEALVYSPMVAGSASNYLDWLMMALSRHRSMNPLYETYGLNCNLHYGVNELPVEIVVESRGSLEELDPNQISLEEVKGIDEENESDENLDALFADFNWIYPHKKILNLTASQSVSELKRQAMEEDETVHYTGPEREPTPTVPEFLMDEVPLTGAMKGTIFHKVMDKLDFGKKYSASDIDAFLIQLVEEGILTERETRTVYSPSVSAFTSLPIYERVMEAQALRCLYKEQPFVMGLPVEGADDLGDMAMVQGVIDLFFEEEDGLVLIDYKTDYMKDVADQVLIDRYKEQMKHYGQAIYQMKGKEVKEIYLYAVAVRKLILVPFDDFII